MTKRLMSGTEKRMRISGYKTIRRTTDNNEEDDKWQQHQGIWQTLLGGPLQHHHNRSPLDQREDHNHLFGGEDCVLLITTISWMGTITTISRA